MTGSGHPRWKVFLERLGTLRQQVYRRALLFIGGSVLMDSPYLVVYRDAVDDSR